MNKKVLLFIIVIMVIALLVLVAIQAYWIKNAIAIKEANFSRNVKESMSTVIYKLEKMEVTDRIRTKMHGNKQGRKLVNTIDSINQIFNKELEANAGDSSRPSQNIFNVTSEKIRVVVLQEHTGEIIKRYDTSYITIQKKGDIDNLNNDLFSETSNSNYNIDSVTANKFLNVENKINKYLDKTSLVNDVFEDMFNLKHYSAIENRLNFALLDSLINNELKNNGIYTDYEFGVYDPLRNVMVPYAARSDSNVSYHKELLEHGYSYNMFPRDLFMTPEYILIYFPHRGAYLLSQLWQMIVLSSLLVLVITLSFIYTIVTIFKQKRLSEMKNDFINNMTHEFKTPISTIALACEALDDRDISRSEPMQKKYISVINEENKRLGTMAEKILQTAVIDKGQVNLHFELINIHQTIDDLITNMHLQAEAKDGKIITDFHARNYYLKADKTHLINVMYNLIDNAIKYTPGKPLVKVKTQNSPTGILITVEDNGIGISKANQSKVFEKLFRVSTGNLHDVKGFGLGLHYVKTIVEMHHGTVIIESEIKKGTRVKINLPFGNKN
ncbi:MAG: HAMP domain-containing sensor histidine kinase [Bacteroidota bacterium]